MRGHILPQVRNPFSALPPISVHDHQMEVAVLASTTTFPFIHQNIPTTTAAARTQIDLVEETNPIPDLHLNEGLERGYTL